MLIIGCDNWPGQQSVFRHKYMCNSLLLTFYPYNAFIARKLPLILKYM